MASTPDLDKWGKVSAFNKFDKETEMGISAHILSFDPQISHYCRSHAPNCLYLPPSLSIAKMYSMYIARSVMRCIDEK